MLKTLLSVLVLAAGILVTVPTEPEEPTKPPPHEGPYSTVTQSSQTVSTGLLNSLQTSATLLTISSESAAQTDIISTADTRPSVTVDGYSSFTTSVRSQTVAAALQPSPALSLVSSNNLLPLSSDQVTSSVDLTASPALPMPTTAVGFVSRRATAVPATTLDIQKSSSGTSMQQTVNVESIVLNSSTSVIHNVVLVSTPSQALKTSSHGTIVSSSVSQIVPSVSTSEGDVLHSESWTSTLPSVTSTVIVVSTVSQTALSAGDVLHSEPSTTSTPSAVLQSSSASIYVQSSVTVKECSSVIGKQTSIHSSVTMSSTLPLASNNLSSAGVYPSFVIPSSTAAIPSSSPTLDVLPRITSSDTQTVTHLSSTSTVLHILTSTFVSPTAPVRGVPSQPSQPLVYKVTANSVDLVWNTTSYATNYTVEYSKDPKLWSQPSCSNAVLQSGCVVTTKKALVVELKPFTRYFFRVFASNAFGNSNSSKEQVLTTFEAAPSGPPVKVAIGDTSANTVQLTWQPPKVESRNGVILRYLIRWNTTVGAETSYNTVDNSTDYEVSGLTAYTHYYFTVQAKTAVGLGPASTPVFHTTLQSVPTKPRNVEARSVNYTTIRITWEEPSPPNGVIKYRLFYRQLGEECMPLAFDGQKKEFVVTGLRQYTEYEFKVKAYNVKLGHEGPPVTVVARTDSTAPSGPPLNVRAITQNSTSILVQWSPPIKSARHGDILGYTVKYNDSLNQHMLSSGNTTDNSTLLLISGLKPYTVYYFTVQAKNTVGLGPGSEPVFNRTSEDIPGAPSIDSIKKPSSSVLSVKWIPPVNANGRILGYLLCWNLLLSGNPVCNETGQDRLIFQISGLTPYSQYNVSLSAETSKGFGPSVSGVYRTAEGLPSQPRSVQGWNTGAMSIFLQWEEPEHINGILKGYQVVYRKEAGTLPSTPVSTELFRNRTLSGLEPYTVYVITVRAVTGAGPGDAEDVKVTTDESAPSVVLGMELTDVQSSHVNITWNAPERPNGKIGYRVAYWTLVRPQVMYPRIEVPLGRTYSPVSNLKPYTYYTFSVIPYNLKKNIEGPSMNVTRRTDTGVPSGPPLNVKVVHKSAKGISLSWSEPAQPNGKIVYYQVFYRLSSATKPEKYLTDSEHHNFENLEPFREYILQVTAATSKGSGPYSKELRVRTDPDNPPPLGTVKPPTDTEVSAHGFIVKLVEASDENGKISYYQVIVLELASDRSGDVIGPSEKPDAFKPDELLTYDEANQLKLTRKPYITVEFRATDFEKYATFTVGGGEMMSLVSRKRRSSAPSNRTGYYNGPLKESTYYTVFQRAYVSKDLYSSGSWIKPVATAMVGKTGPHKKPVNTLVAALAAFAIILLVCIIVGVLYLRRRRKRPDFMLDDQMDVCPRGQQMRLRALSRRRMRSQTGKTRLMGSTDSLDELDQMALLRQRRTPIPIEDFETHVERNHVDGDIGFSEEYEVVEPDMEFTWVHTLNPVNKYKNRYANIVSYDHSRVMLTPLDGVPGSDYINANYIDGFNRSGEYIATQGTLPETFDDFWRMVWEQETATIVMLTNLEEKGRKKCDQYWPEDGCTESYGKIEVTHTNSHNMSSYVVRTFAVSHAESEDPEEERVIKQFHFITWPDHGVPSHATPVLSFVRHVSRSNPPSSGPMVVHCSAGVGRTGTFIAIDSLLQSTQKEDTLDVFGFVRQMRTKRNLMVQTEAQYVFIHDALLEAITCGVTEVHANDLRIRTRELRRIDADTGLTFMEKEFLRLTHEQKNPLVFKSASLNCNTLKNRYANILPFENTRVKLEMQPGVVGSDYINANYLDGYCQPRAFIATQAPVPDTIQDFWRMIWEQDCGVIMMLTKEQEGGKLKCHCYWPCEEPLRYGDVLVELVDEKLYSDYNMREFQITHTQVKSTRIIRQFQYTGWPDVGLPDSGTGIIDLIGQLQKWQQHSGNKTIVVHCSGGVGRTGVFIAISTMIERVKTEGVIDVFQTVQTMRLKRPAMVQTKEQYEFCYSTLQEYLDSFDLYANFQ